MSRMVEMAYSPVSSVSTGSSPAPLPPDDTAENTCAPHDVQVACIQADFKKLTVVVQALQICYPKACAMTASIPICLGVFLGDECTLRMLLRKPRRELRLMQLTKASVMYCAWAHKLTFTKVHGEAS